VGLLIDHVRYDAYDKHYLFVSLGLHDRDPLQSVVQWMLRYTFDCVGLICSLSGDNAAVARIRSSGVPMEDFALV
jgi:hypothetical protein